MKRSGHIYSEFTNKGIVHKVGGKTNVYGFRYVAEISIHRKRYRFRSTNYSNCQRWMDRMIYVGYIADQQRMIDPNFKSTKEWIKKKL